MFRLVYKVVYEPKDDTHGLKTVTKELVVGRQAFFPNFDLSRQSGYVKDRDIELVLDQCPALAIIADTMWDANEVAQAAEDMVVRLRASLSNTADLKSEKEHRELEGEYLAAHLEQKAVAQDGGKVTVDPGMVEELARLEAENVRLRADREKLRADMRQQARVATAAREAPREAAQHGAPGASRDERTATLVDILTAGDSPDV